MHALSLALLLCAPCCVLGQLFNLSSLHWTLRNQNGSVVVPATVPSQVHLDLVKAGIITEPLLGANGALPSPAFQLALILSMKILRSDG